MVTVLQYRTSVRWIRGALGYLQRTCGERDELRKVLNQKKKVPLAEYIRQGIDLVLDRYKSQLPGQVIFDEL